MHSSEDRLHTGAAGRRLRTFTTVVAAGLLLILGGCDWGDLDGIPGGFADGVDNDTQLTPGAGLTETGGVVEVDFDDTDSHSGSSDLVARGDHDHDDDYVLKAGDTMTGALILNANPVDTLGAATRQYVDAAVAGVGGATIDGVSNPGGDIDLVAGANIVITPDDVNDEIEIAVFGGTLSGLDADTVDALHAADFWQLGGNAGTTPGTDFIGTADNQPLELHVNGARALRLEPETATGGPNVLAGASVNTISGGVVGATVAGGGNPDAGSPSPNSVTVSYGTVGGGLGNTASGLGAVIGGGRNNVSSSNRSTVAGGDGNTASDSYATVAGGDSNEALSIYSTVAGGTHNTASNTSATVGGGQTNVASGMCSVIAGGPQNQATAECAAIGGGALNVASGIYSTVPGGGANAAAGDYSLAAGRRAKANHAGAFVWADSTDADFASQAADTFTIRAANGVGINTAAAPASALDVNGTVTATGFAGDGSGLGGVWKLGGNGVTDPTTEFIGATASALELHAGSRALRLEPGPASPNLLAGFSGNSILAGASGAAVGGGGYLANVNIAYDNYCVVSGGFNNVAGTDEGNVAFQSCAAVGGGYNNTASAHCSTVGGGAGSSATGLCSTVAGGQSNVTSGDYAAVPGGHLNTAMGAYSLGAGRRAKAFDQGAFVWADSTDADFASVADNEFAARATGGVRLVTGLGAGATGNLVSGHDANSVTAGATACVVAGGGASGMENLATDDYSVVGGGLDNQAGDADAGTDPLSAPYASVGGGLGNTASGPVSSVGGGTANTASGQASTVGGGWWNQAASDYATVPGGFDNEATGANSLAAGTHAKANHAGAFVWADSTATDFASAADNEFAVRATGGVRLSVGDFAAFRVEPDVSSPNVIAGCSDNAALDGARGAMIGGGVPGGMNWVTDNWGVVAGGYTNRAGDMDGDPANAQLAVVSGGAANIASAEYSTVSGGAFNQASGVAATVSGGQGNRAMGTCSAVGGGDTNWASGLCSVIPGGSNVSVSGDYAFAAGRQASAAHAGAFVWADSTDAPLVSTAADQFLVRASGGVGINTASPGSALHVAGPITTATRAVAVDDSLTDADSVLFVDSSGASRTITLPAASAATVGRVYHVYKADASVADTVTVQAAGGGDVLNGATTITQPWGCLRIIGFKDTEWIGSLTE